MIVIFNFKETMDQLVKLDVASADISNDRIAFLNPQIRHIELNSYSRKKKLILWMLIC